MLTADNSYLIEYKERIDCGEIVAGQDLRLELENLIEDLKCERYLYNRDDALIRINFLENCVRLTKSPFYNKPMRLLLFQKAFIETVYSFKMPDSKLRRFKKVLPLYFSPG